jgi:hypothetical protein
LIPALSYLNQFERLVEKAQSGNLTSAEFALLDKLDLAELHQFAQARDLSRELLEKWLSQYKFKNWTMTETRHKTVDMEMRRARAAELAEALSDNERWHSHGRGINMKALQEMNLKIVDFSADPKLASLIREYYGLLTDYIGRQNVASFVRTEEHF